jgi:hypothetical protein
MKETKYDRKRIIELCDGTRSSSEIAKIVGCPAKYVQKLAKKLDLPRLQPSARAGEKNHQWKTGRIIDKDGYVTVPAPAGHPGARKTGRILEHRLVMGQKLGRHLSRGEVVDHIDGNTLNNSPENLRLFANNGAHLSETLRGRRPKWSEEGIAVIQGRASPGVDTHAKKKKSYVVRTQKILRARELLGKEIFLYAR